MSSGSLFLSKAIGIDLGTTNVLVWVEGRGVVINEPTVVAVSVKDRRVVAVGEKARGMIGRTPDSLVASTPIRGDVIADYAVTEALLRSLLHRAMGRSFFLKPEVVVSVPAGSTQVERRAVFDAVLSAGARSVSCIDKPLAAMIGAGVVTGEASGNMVVDIGGGLSEVAVVSLGGVVAGKSIRVGGETLDDVIVKYVRKKCGVIIGMQTAEHMKKEIGSAVLNARDARDARDTRDVRDTPDTRENQAKTLTAKGRDAVTGTPKECVVDSRDIFQAIEGLLHQQLEMIRSVLEQVPPELASDILDKGILLTGGGALLSNLDSFFAEAVRVPVIVAEDPTQCVIRGIGVVASNLDAYRHVVHKNNDRRDM